jgi:1-acyl-sn-glycerol-3-phosphate acyltransferase
VARPIVRVVHRATLEGTEHLPEGPFLLVGNHPSSYGIPEFLSLAALYVARFGDTRPLAGFAFAATFRWWPLSRLFPHIGAIPSTYEAAEETLAACVPIVVFPGGDHEGFRPFWQARRVDFAGRLGFLRVARKAGVPIVPMAIRGITAPIAIRARWLAYLAVWPRFAGVKRYGLSVLAVIGAVAILAFVPWWWPWRVALAWAWAASPLALLPWIPARITIRIGTPLPPDSSLAEVEAAVQALLNT